MPGYGRRYAAKSHGKMNKHLLNATMDAVSFFANCDDGECDPDASVRMLENMAHHLQQLTKKQKSDFAAHCEKLADAEDDPDESEFLSQVPTHLGL